MIRRGQIWWADLAAPRESEPGYRHAVLVLQRDEVNASRISTVVVCLLTSNTALARAPGNTLPPRRRTGLRRAYGPGNQGRARKGDVGSVIEFPGVGV